MSHKKAQKSQRVTLVWLASALTIASIILLIIAAPLAAASGHQQLANSIYGGFAIVCHQIPARSYFIAGHQFAICSRCTGVYAGFAVTLLSYPLLRPLRRFIPPIGGMLDLTPLVAYFILVLLSGLVVNAIPL